MNYKLLIFAIFTLHASISSHVLAQSTVTNKSKNLIGSWSECQEMTFDKSYVCNNKNLIYTFRNDFTFSQYQSVPQYYIEATSLGKWNLNGTHLTLDLNDTKETISAPTNHTIHWINNDLFYYSGQEGKDGPTVYTYYQRINQNTK